MMKISQDGKNYPWRVTLNLPFYEIEAYGASKDAALAAALKFVEENSQEDL